ncbi:MAG: hypothetical protein MUF80_11525 [Burkholderiales bacterium]|nr:hypothetical protein [Burkholderiales bacterium]
MTLSLLSDYPRVPYSFVPLPSDHVAVCRKAIDGELLMVLIVLVLGL